MLIDITHEKNLQLIAAKSFAQRQHAFKHLPLHHHRIVPDLGTGQTSLWWFGARDEKQELLQEEGVVLEQSRGGCSKSLRSEMRIAAQAVQLSQNPRMVSGLVLVRQRETEHKLFHPSSLLVRSEHQVANLASLGIGEEVKEGLLDDGMSVEKSVKRCVGGNRSGSFDGINDFRKLELLCFVA